MRRILTIILLAGMAAGLLAACGGPGAAPTATITAPTTAPTATTTAPSAAASPTPAVSPAAKAMEDYWQAIVSKDVNKVSTLACKDYEAQALQLLDSFQAVDAKLDSLVCTQSGTSNGSALVQCTGMIITTYNNENSELDLSGRTYLVTQSGGDWLVCGEQ